MTASLTFYFASAASTTVSTMNQLYVVGGAAQSGYPFVFVNIGAGHSGYGQLWAQGNAGAWAGAGSLPADDDHGFILETTRLNMEGQQFIAGNWTPTVRLTGMISSSATGGTVTGDIICRASKRSSGGVYTTIATSTLTAQTLTGTATTYTLPTVTGILTNINTGDRPTWSVWFNVTSLAGGAIGIRMNRESNDTTNFLGDPNAQFVTAGYQAQTSNTPSTMLNSDGMRAGYVIGGV